MKNLLVGQSGGPTAVINASLWGVLHEAALYPEQIGRVYGMRNGVEGFLKGHFIDLGASLDAGARERLKYTPGSFLGSCRFRLPEDLDAPIYQELLRLLQEQDIGYFLYIGGNDSMDTVCKLSAYAARTGSSIRFVGIPKTIDNDLVLTDHTPGFGSAAKFVATAVREIGIDAAVYEASSATIVEIMGRHAGWLTAASALARKFPGDNPALIYLPEIPFDQEAFLGRLQEVLAVRRNAVVCVSEGLRDRDGNFLCEYAAASSTDQFGHKQLSGCGRYLAQLVKERLGIKTRTVEFNVSQRCAAQEQSLTDLSEAIDAGAFGVRSAVAGKTGCMVTFSRNTPYSISYGLADVSLVCNQEKTVPREWISLDGSDVTPALASYILPLIQGSPSIPMKDGMPDFVYLQP